MGAYRLYRVDGNGGFSSAEWIEAEDDEAALVAASSVGGSGPRELWQGTRLVARIERGGHDDDQRSSK